MQKKMMNPNPKKTAAIITAEGFGDGLLMLIAANVLKENGYSVTVFNKHLPSLKNLLPHFSLYPYSENFESYSNFDLVILQNDNSQRAKNIISLRSKFPLNLHVFYPSYKESKHGRLDANDAVFDENIPMVENIFIALKNIFPKSSIEKKTGLVLPEYLCYKKNSRRVVIHPLSGDPNRNWSKEKFLKLYSKIYKSGFDPVFVISTKEKWFFEDQKEINFKAFDSLSDLCCFLYESGFFIGNESGPSHLASYLQIPSIIITNNKKRMRLWQPGWKKANIISPPSFIPNIKKLRLKEKQWTLFIPVFTVFKSFKKLLLKNNLQQKLKFKC